MELRLERLWPKETYTIGRLYINNEFFCNTLEDKIVDKNKNGIFDNGEKKVYGESAIPYGTYNIIYNWSPKFGRNLPRLLNVPHFEGILIHSGNTAADSAGCILVGKNSAVGRLSESRYTSDCLNKKMKRQNKTLDQIYDLTAVRIIVDTVDQCYELFGKIHQEWKPIPGRIKDYIATPKENMYQSLHTTVVTNIGKIFEIQIRTKEMNRTAEFGIAAHWKYKENKENTDAFDKRLSWIREVMEWQGGLNNSTEFLESIKGDLYNNEVLVFTPKGEVISLVKDATPIDYAYKIHTEVGNKCVGAKVNGKMVPLNTTLQVGDVVEIITSKLSKGPSWDWLRIAKSSGAKAKIKAFYKKAMQVDNERVGKTMLENEARNRGYNFGDLLNPISFERLSQKLSVSTPEEMYAAVGCAAITVNSVLLKLIDFHKKETPIPDKIADSKIKRSSENVGGVKIKGMSGLLVRFAGCCNPVPGDDIVGFVSRGRGVTVHRRDCPNMKNEDPGRLLEAEWVGDQGSYSVSVRVVGGEDAPILVCVSNACTELGLLIVSVNGRIDAKNHQSIVEFTIKLGKKGDLDLLINKVEQNSCITEIFRI